MKLQHYLFFAAFLTGCGVAAQYEEPISGTDVSPLELQITSIYWNDGDSGVINGDLRFRLNDIDAPETGGVGAAIGPAYCENERELGYDAKEFVVEFTRHVDLAITATEGYDRMPKPRLIINLSADGVDVAQAGIDAGHLAAWPHEGSKKLAPKPDWCL